MQDQNSQDPFHIPSDPQAPVTDPPQKAIYHKGVAPGMFGLIIVCFFMTFMVIKCGDVPVGNISGIEAATGLRFDDGSSSAPGENKKPNIFALLALLAAVTGFGLAFLKARKGSISQLVCGFSGALMLVLLFISVRYDVKRLSDASDGYMGIVIQFATGYWLALLLFIAAGVIGVLKLREQRQ